MNGLRDRIQAIADGLVRPGVTVDAWVAELPPFGGAVWVGYEMPERVNGEVVYSQGPIVHESEPHVTDDELRERVALMLSDILPEGDERG